MSRIIAFCMGAGFAVITLFAYQKINGAEVRRGRVSATACIEANMTWEPSYNRLGAFKGIRCNPDVPFDAAIGATHD